MSRRDSEYDDELDDTDDELDPEGPDESEMDDSDEPDEVQCPHCGASISELAEWCPRCEQYISGAGDSRAGSRLWLLLGVILAIAVVIVWVVLR